MDHLKPAFFFTGLPSLQHWPAHKLSTLILVASGDSKFISLYLSFKDFPSWLTVVFKDVLWKSGPFHLIQHFKKNPKIQENGILYFNIS